MDVKAMFDINEKPLDKLLEGCGFCNIFRSMACIGDSLASGEFEVFDDGVRHCYDMIDYSWMQYIGRACNSRVLNFTRGGMTAKEYMEGYAEANGYWDEDKRCQAYVIALGVNDIVGCHRPIGTVADIADDGTFAADTFISHYGAIINRYKKISPDAKFFLLTLPKLDLYNTGDVAAVSQAVRDIGAHFTNTYVLDLEQYGPVYDADFRKAFFLNGHMTPTGYSLTARIVMSYIDYIIRHNMEDFKLVGFCCGDLEGTKIL